MSIQAVKGVEIGDGFEVAGRRGSAAHDAIAWDEARRANTAARSRLAGGTEGGMTTGELLVVRAAMKPLATLNQPTLKTVDVVTKESTVSFKERTDVTAVPAMGVVAETMVALVRGGRGATQVRRRLAGRVRAQRRVVPQLARLAVVGVAADQHLVLVGLMGSGKTTVARIVADRLGRRVIDSDAVIEKRHRSHRARDLRRRRRGCVPCVRDRGAARCVGYPGAVRDRCRRRCRAARREPVGAEAGQRQGRVAVRDAGDRSSSGCTSSGHRPLLDDDPAGTLQRMYDERVSRCTERWPTPSCWSTTAAANEVAEAVLR